MYIIANTGAKLFPIAKPDRCLETDCAVSPIFTGGAHN
jgi:hypothetical protein